MAAQITRQAIVAALAVVSLSLTARSQASLHGVLVGWPGFAPESLRVSIDNGAVQIAQFAIPDSRGDFMFGAIVPGTRTVCLFPRHGSQAWYCTSKQIGIGQNSITLIAPRLTNNPASGAQAPQSGAPQPNAATAPPGLVGRSVHAVAPSAAAAPRPQPATCQYAGQTYSDYAVTCQAHQEQQCVAGVWKLVRNVAGYAVPC